jgi:cobalt-zinc-cadmium efflux system membrane fusion protein
VHADIKNDRQLLIPGMYVNALIDIGETTVKALPAEAVVKADGREFIFVLEEGHDEEGEGHGHEAEEADGHANGHGHEEGEEKVHADSGEHEGTHGESYHFQRIEVKTGTEQLGYVQVTPVQHLEPGAKLVLKGAYYIQSHLLKSEGGGRHEH